MAERSRGRMSEATLAERLQSARILAVIRRPDVADVGLDLLRRLYGVGVRAIEFTLDQPGAMAVIEKALAIAPVDMLVGGGTVTRPQDIRRLAGIGAHFAVSPHHDHRLSAQAHEAGISLIPGVLSPTEVTAAVESGADVLKLFPAGPMGPEYLRTLKGPFSSVAFVPTGGVQMSDLQLWFDAGALCVALGSALTADEASFDQLGAVLGR